MKRCQESCDQFEENQCHWFTYDKVNFERAAGPLRSNISKDNG